MKRRCQRAAAAWAVCVLVPATLRSQTAPPTDSAVAVALVTAARGATPLLCDLAARSVENQWGWSGPMDVRAPRDPVARAALSWSNRRGTNPAAVPVLVAALEDDDACVRRIAAPLLGRVNHPTARGALRSALRDDRQPVREAAAIGLGFTDDPAVIPALLAGLQDTVPHVRALCAWALGNIEDRRALGALVRVLREDRDAEVRAAAAWAIGEIEG